MDIQTQSSMTHLSELSDVLHELFHHLSDVQNVHGVGKAGCFQGVGADLVSQSHRVGGVDGHLDNR